MPKSIADPIRLTLCVAETLETAKAVFLQCTSGTVSFTELVVAFRVYFRCEVFRGLPPLELPTRRNHLPGASLSQYVIAFKKVAADHNVSVATDVTTSAIGPVDNRVREGICVNQIYCDSHKYHFAGPLCAWRQLIEW